MAFLEFSRRAATLVCAMAAVVTGFGYGMTGLAVALAVAAAGAYVLPPQPPFPLGATRHERVAAVWLPDMLGILLATTFLSLPFVIAAHEPWLGGPWGPMLLTWPPGLVALAIFRISARHACWWMVIGAEEMRIGDMGVETTIRYADIVRATRETVAPPRWLSPMLILLGGWRGLGVALLHGGRASHWLVLELRDAPSLRVPLDALPLAEKLARTLEKAGVPVDRGLAGVRGRRGKRKKAGCGSCRGTGEIDACVS